MKKILFVFGLLLSLPFYTFAHGGVSKVINNSFVYLNQTPLSPLVGERVTFVVSLTDLKQAPLRSVPVEVKVIDTFYNDATKDKIIRIENFTTNPNGSFQFVQEFDKENYFDIEFFFNDPETGQQNQIGFLVQPRENKKFSDTAKIIFAGLIGLDIGIFIWLLRRKNN